MSSFEARLRLYGDAGPPIKVDIDLSDEHMHLMSGDIEVANWAVEDLRVSALEDGFHIRAEGEDVLLEVDDDARFAVELGLRNAHPSLRRRMSQLLRENE